MTENGNPVADDGAHGPEEQGAQEQEPRQGRIRYQDPETTQAREPTLAEQRARIAAEKRREEQRQAELAAAERKSQTRRRVMIGGGATVGVVALVAALYSASEVSNQANAVSRYCGADQNGQATVQSDQFCDEHYVTTHGGHVDHHTGMFFMPIVLPGGGFGGFQSYRYGYTDPGAPPPRVGQTVPHANYSKPSGSTIKDSTGKTVQRGGFGISSKSGSSGS